MLYYFIMLFDSDASDVSNFAYTYVIMSIRNFRLLFLFFIYLNHFYNISNINTINICKYYVVIKDKSTRILAHLKSKN